MPRDNSSSSVQKNMSSIPTSEAIFFGVVYLWRETLMEREGAQT